MKKIVTFILLMCMVLTFVACTDNGIKTPENTTSEETTLEGTTPEETTTEEITTEITAQDIYDSSKVSALLEKYDSILVVRTANGEVYQEDYYSKEYCYSLFDGGESDAGFLSTDKSFFFYVEDIYSQAISISPDGIADEKEFFAEELETNYLLTDMLNDTIMSVTEIDGNILVTSFPDQEEIDEAKAQGWNIVDGEEYVLDAKTLDVISVKGGSVNDSGEKYEGAISVTYNVEIPEGMKKLVEYAQQTENMRTVTFVSNPGTDNEKTESIQVPKGLQVDFFADSEDLDFTLYADAACTQEIELNLDVDSDLTVYVKWN